MPVEWTFWSSDWLQAKNSKSKVNFTFIIHKFLKKLSFLRTSFLTFFWCLSPPRFARKVLNIWWALEGEIKLNMEGGKLFRPWNSDKINQILFIYKKCWKMKPAHKSGYFWKSSTSTGIVCRCWIFFLLL